MKILLLVLLLIHGLFHIWSFRKTPRRGDADGARQQWPPVIGVLWLATAVLLAGSFLLLVLNDRSWWIAALVAVAISQFLIIRNWDTMKYGTLINLIIIVPIITSFSEALPSGWRNRFRAEVQKRLTAQIPALTVTEEDIRHLPEPVGKYLRYTGTVGKPKVCNFRATFRGTMRRSMDGNWMEIAAEQYDFFAGPARMFFIESSLYGIPFDGFHMYIGDSATMRINVAHIFEVADAKGEKMTRSETVTLFNDMCIMAPSTLIDSSIDWSEVDSVTVDARFTNGGYTISASLHFDEDGRLVDFISNDRYLSVDGKTYTNYPWSTPLRDYRDLEGRTVAGHADMIWHTPQGEFTYGRFDLADIHYNCTELR